MACFEGNNYKLMYYSKHMLDLDLNWYSVYNGDKMFNLIKCNAPRDLESTMSRPPIWLNYSCKHLSTGYCKTMLFSVEAKHH